MQPKLISSQPWRLEVRDQGVGSFGFSWGFSLGLADGCLLLCPHVAFSDTPGVSSSSHKNTSHIRWAATLAASFWPLERSGLQIQMHSLVVGWGLLHLDLPRHSSAYNSAWGKIQVFSASKTHVSSPWCLAPVTGDRFLPLYFRTSRL